MDAMQAILTRRSVRQYTDEPVPEDTVQRLLSAAMHAPSACDARDWQFVAVDERKLLDAIPDYHPYAGMLKQAPLAIVVCGDTRLEKFKGFWVQDCSAAAQNLLLAAHALGLGAVWLGCYPGRKLITGTRRLLGLPKEVVPLAIIAVGHPAQEPAKVERYDVSRVHRNGW